MPAGEGIRIFARLKPTSKASPFLEVDPDANAISFNFPKDTANGILVNNTKTNFAFKFDGVFGMDATQEDVFNVVAKSSVDSVLEGYNATIFAYGQTGSGKTFTITGGTSRYADRGVIPRALSYLFERCKADTGAQYSVYISFLEIYNEAGFDLLAEQSQDAATGGGAAGAELQKVVIMEDDNGNMHLKVG
jgi:kinesin family protein 6/9